MATGNGVNALLNLFVPVNKHKKEEEGYMYITNMLGSCPKCDFEDVMVLEEVEGVTECECMECDHVFKVGAKNDKIH